MNSLKKLLIACVCVLLVAQAGRSQVLDCPVITSGGSVSADGSVHLIGEAIIGRVGGAGIRLDQGNIPCWLDFLGDLNCDGIVNLLDLPHFIQVLLDPAGFAGCDLTRADMNGDTLEDGEDIQLFVTALLLP